MRVVHQDYMIACIVYNPWEGNKANVLTERILVQPVWLLIQNITERAQSNLEPKTLHIQRTATSIQNITERAQKDYRRGKQQPQLKNRVSFISLKNTLWDRTEFARPKRPVAYFTRPAYRLLRSRLKADLRRCQASLNMIKLGGWPHGESEADLRRCEACLKRTPTY